MARAVAARRLTQYPMAIPPRATTTPPASSARVQGSHRSAATLTGLIRWALLHLLWRERGAGRLVAMTVHRPRPAGIARSAFAGFCFPAEVIVLAVRWYLRFGLSYRDVEELLAERGIE